MWAVTLLIFVQSKMKICLFSDIHGNGVAFDAAYNYIIDENADLNIFLGDLCGYYFDEVEIYEKLVLMPRLISVRGNHDNMFLSAFETSSDIQIDYSLKYGSSMRNFLKKDNRSFVKWLKEMPEFYINKDLKFSCFHGSPNDKLEGYVYPDTDLVDFKIEKQEVFFLGHTHYPMHRIIEEKLVVNPGSLGQPRQGGWPTYAVITFPEKKVEFHQFRYDVHKAIKNIEKKGEEKAYLKNALLRCYE